MNIRKYTDNRSKVGKGARAVTDFFGGRGIRESAGDYAAGRKVNKTKLALGVAGVGASMTGVAGVGRAVARKVGSKLTYKAIPNRYAGKLVGNKTITQAKTKRAIAKHNPYGGAQGRKQRRFERDVMNSRKKKK